MVTIVKNWPYPFRRIGPTCFVQERTRIEEDAGGDTTVAPSSGLGDILPNYLKESRCPFFGMKFDSDALVSSDEVNRCVVATLLEETDGMCSVVACGGACPSWTGCPRSKHPSAKSIISMLSETRVIFSGDFQMNFAQWYDYRVKKTKPA